MRTVCALLAVAMLLESALTAQNQDEARKAMLARAKALELNTPYVPPPGDPLEHYASGYAKIMCSSVFVTGLDPAFAAENVGYFTAPYAERAKLGTPQIDRSATHRARDDAQRYGADRKTRRQPGLRHVAHRSNGRVLQAIDRQECPASGRHDALADGRPVAARRSGRRRRRRKGAGRRGCGVRSAKA